MTKKKSLVISIVAFVAAYLLIEFIPSNDFWGYDWFPSLHYFNAAVILSWFVVLYFVMARLMTFKVCILCAVLVAVCALPYSIFLVCVYPSWVVFGVSVVLEILLIVWAIRLRPRGVKK